MIRVHSATLAICSIVFSVNGYGQNAASALPQDPTALMMLAHEKNGLTGNDIKPWHMHGTYHSYKDGKTEYEGTYEEWWISPTQYKVSFSNPKQTQTDYATGAALLRDGTQEWLSGPELRLRGSLVDPLPYSAELKELTLQLTERAIGRSKIECVSFTYPVRGNLKVTGDFYPAACFESSIPVLLLFTHNGSRTVHDHLVAFQNHYIARQIRIFHNGKVEADLNLDVVESLKQPPDSVLSAPATAMPVDLTKIEFKESKTQWPPVLRKAVPIYPEGAKAWGVQGDVMIRGTIGTDGHVENPQPVSGPPALRGPSIDAVRQWAYRPFQVMGQPRPVEISIHLIFSMG